MEDEIVAKWEMPMPEIIMLALYEKDKQEMIKEWTSKAN
jgi:hypothetical protein